MKIPIGKTLKGDSFDFDLTTDPHLLIAGKSRERNVKFLLELIKYINNNYSSDEVKLLLAGPKNTKLIYPNKKRNFFDEVLDRHEKILLVLQWLNFEMNARFATLGNNQIISIEKYNLKAKVKMPYVFLLIDEYSDLMMFRKHKEVEELIVKILAKGRAVGLHLFISTTRSETKYFPSLTGCMLVPRLVFPTSKLRDLTVFSYYSVNKKNEKDFKKLGKGEAYFTGNSTNLKLIKIKSIF